MKTAKTLLLVTFLFSALHVLPALRAQGLGGNNPTGVAGQFNGNVTTGGSYDPYTGNATRAITDMAVPGAVGKYGLSFSRIWNSRLTPNQFTWQGGWRHSYEWSIDQITVPHDHAIQSYRISFPDGRVEDFHAAAGDPGYWHAALGTQERLFNTVSIPATGRLIYLMLPDGGKVEFRITRTVETGADSYDTYDFEALGMIDPHGIRTDFTHPGDGSLTIAEPPGAGRWIKIFYRSITANGVLYSVVDYVRGSDGREVHYTYQVQAFPTGSIT